MLRISAGLRATIEVSADVFGQVGDLLVQGAGLDRQVVGRRVGRSDQNVVVPGDREEDAAVIGARNQESRVARHERSIQDEVGTLAERQERLASGVIESPQGIDEDPGCVDHGSGLDRELKASFHVAGDQAGDPAVAPA